VFDQEKQMAQMDEQLEIVLKENRARL